MALWKKNVSFVLVEPKEGGNIGASARAIKNMGFSDLLLVRPSGFPSEEAVRFAADARDMVEKAKVFSHLKDALSEKPIVAGTSRRAGKTRGLILGLPDGAKRISEAARKNKVAVLFGREDRGLLNKEAEECGFLINIRTDSSPPSLNLAQSVLLTAYEIARAEAEEPAEALRPRSEVEELLERAENVICLLKYRPRGLRDVEANIFKNLRRMTLRAGLTHWELRMLHGLLSRVENAAGIEKSE